MKKKQLAKWALPWIFGWFLAVQSGHEIEGVLVTTEVGPFATKQQCKAELASLREMLEAFFMEYKVVKNCEYYTQEV